MRSEKEASEKSFIEVVYWNLDRLLKDIFKCDVTRNDEEHLARICVEMHKDYWEDFKTSSVQRKK